MRTSLVVALAWFATACGGDASGGVEPYGGARAQMCGEEPTGIWHLEITSETRATPNQSVPLCKMLSGFEWDFAKADHVDRYDDGCGMVTSMLTGSELDQLRLMWVDQDKWTGIISVDAGSCGAIADAVLTR